MKLFLVRFDYWEDGILLVAAENEERAGAVVRASERFGRGWLGDLRRATFDEVKGASVAGLPRIIWEP